MVIVIKGLSYNEVTEYLEARGAGEGSLDIYVDDYGFVDADAGDMRRMVEIDTNSLDMEQEDFLVEVTEDLADAEPDAEVIYL